MADVRDELLRIILENITVTSKATIEWTGSQFLNYGRALQVFLSDLMINSKLKSKLNQLRYYLNTEDSAFFGNELQTIFKTMKQENKKSYSEFENELESFLKKIKKKCKTKKYEIYFPLNIKNPGSIQAIKFKDITIEFKSASEIKLLFQQKKFISDFGSTEFDKTEHEYLKITIYARNEEYAKEIGVKYSNMVLGVITFSQNFRKTSTRYTGVPKELSKLKIKYILIFEEQKYKMYYYTDSYLENKKQYEITNTDIKNLNDIIHQFDLASLEIQEVIHKSITAYYLGLTEKQTSYSFLNFWTSLEIITLKKKDTPHYEIINRLKSILKNLTELEKHKIDRIYSLRNNLVHDGAYNISQYDRNLLKTYVELFIDFFIFKLVEYKVQEIGDIFQFMQKNEQTLTNNKKLIDFVINLKRN